MKRSALLAGSSAAILAGCHGGGATPPLPSGVQQAGVKPSGKIRYVDMAGKQRLPTQPFVGEVRRWDAAVPNGWVLCTGQVLKIADFPQLYKILGRMAGGDGKTTFALPATHANFVISLYGTFPTSPMVVRRINAQ